MKLTITQIKRYDKDKTGNPLRTKDGKPYTRVLLASQEYGQNWISGFGNQYNESWKEGDTIDVDIEKVEKNGQTYYNFKQVSPIARLEKRIEELEVRVSNLEAPQKPQESSDKVYGPEDEVYTTDGPVGPSEEDLRSAGL